MSRRSVALPARRRDPVEALAFGAAIFDGNSTNRLVSWLFPSDDWTDELEGDMLNELMRHTVFGHLSWTVFPPHGYRVPWNGSEVLGDLNG